MASGRVATPEGIHELSADEAKDLLDRQARQHFKMSWREFVTSWERGDFAKELDRPELMWLVMLIPLAARSDGEE